MPRLLIAAATLAASAMTLHAQAGQDPPRRIAASSFATVEVHVNARPIGGKWYEEDAALTGPSRIAITYSQPHARGRKIVGGLIPTDTVWRFGANTATALHTDVDLTLGRLAIPARRLHALRSSQPRQLAADREPGNGPMGNGLRPAKDLGRITLTAKEMRDNEETLSIYLVPDSQNPGSGYATLSGFWGWVGKEGAFGPLFGEAVTSYRPPGGKRRRSAPWLGKKTAKTDPATS